jgi:hypothetical protein
MLSIKGKIKKLLDGLRIPSTTEIVDLFYNVILQGGAPAGNTTEIQYNLDGEMSSDSKFIRTPKGFFATQAEEGVLDAESILGAGDFTEGGGNPIFAGGKLFFDDETDIFSLAGDLTNLTGEKSILNAIQGQNASCVMLQNEDALDIIVETTAGDEVTNISAATNEAVLKHSSPTLTTQVIVDTLGVTFNFDEGASTYTFPITDGTAGQVLSTDGAGNLAWITP